MPRQDSSGTAYDRAIGARIRSERETRRWSLADLAARLPGVPLLTPTQIAKKERGEEQLNVDFVRRCAWAFQVPLVDLMEGEPPKAFPAQGLASRIIELAEPQRDLVEQLIDQFAARAAAGTSTTPRRRQKKRR